MPKKLKEDRSDWVAVGPDEVASGVEASQQVQKAISAYQFFQRDVSTLIKEEIIQMTGSFDIASHGRAVRDKWNALNEEEKVQYYSLASEDQSRFAQQSHAADVAALERREKLQKQHNQLLLCEEDYATERGKPTTRHKWNKKQRKRMKLEAKKQRGDDELDVGTDESGDELGEQSGDEPSDDDDDSIDSNSKKKINKPEIPQRIVSQKQLEHREKLRKEKSEKEEYITTRQEELQKERANQAKRRLDYLLKQSNIFSHFGQVKEDSAKFGNTNTSKQTSGKNDQEEFSSRHERVSEADEDENEKALEEADEHEATFLTQQPSTLGFGQMREYQLEGNNLSPILFLFYLLFIICIKNSFQFFLGLNWMIRLQENGVNGILADEMGKLINTLLNERYSI